MHDEKILTRFIRDVASHQLEVIREDGLYRHLRFRRPHTSVYYFDLVTWPGYLTVTGDMGTWTFTRIADMFEFFTDSHFGMRDSFLINPGYWSEKFESGAGGSRYDSPCYEFDDDGFDAGLDEWLSMYLEECEDEDDKERASEAVRELKGNGFRQKHEAYQAVENADWPDDVRKWDLMEGMSLQRHSHHYLWICYAIVWGIGRYNATKLVDRSMATFLAFRPTA